MVIININKLAKAALTTNLPSIYELSFWYHKSSMRSIIIVYIIKYMGGDDNSVGKMFALPSMRTEFNPSESI